MLLVALGSTPSSVRSLSGLVKVNSVEYGAGRDVDVCCLQAPSEVRSRLIRASGDPLSMSFWIWLLYVVLTSFLVLVEQGDERGAILLPQ